MKIPILNIYYLLCYAWNRLEERDLVDVDTTDSPEILDLLAKVLCSGMTYLRRRGVDRDYIDYRADESTLRGKINFGETVKRNLLQYARAHCEYDVLSHNVLHNQILKATARRLLDVRELESDRHDDLLFALRSFSEIDDMTIRSRDFRRVRLHRNNAFYGFLLSICELIHDNLFVSEETGETKFRDFLQDKNRMPLLFQHFVRNFYEREQDEYRVGAETIRWDGTAMDDASMEALPTMNTDITMTNATHKIIIDTKYYQETLGDYYGKKTVHSDNLYQLFAYLKNAEAKDELGEDCEGVLLYPTIDDDVSFSYVLGGHKVRVKTIDLSKDWQHIHSDLLDLLAPSPLTTA